MAITLAGLAVAGNQRMAMLVAGVALLPLAGLAPLHDGSYWSPVRFGGWPVGIEDAMFLFQTGALAWLLSAWSFRNRMRFEPQVARFLPRYLSLGAISTALLLGLMYLGLDIMTSSLVGLGTAGLIALIFRPRLWPLAPTGALAYTVFYVVLVHVCFWLWPDYATYWNSASAWSRIVLGVPIGEIAFAAAMGAAYPPLVGFALDAALDAEPRRDG